MQAAIRDRYGPPDVLELQEIEKPELADDGVLVRVRAASLNRADWYGLTGRPLAGRVMMTGLLKPKSKLLGVDFAGTVEAVGKDVTEFRPGNEVFGGRSGSLADCEGAACSAAARRSLAQGKRQCAATAGWRLGAHERCAEALAARGATASARAHHVERSAREGSGRRLFRATGPK
ncbi:MAG TPA: alcohol dehydrogenase catalytic domain-containing protein [Gaiellaceae bacterium]|nr:alcohol dehydrogenase catalytic domain-containing protein [Gaiellaceae bacterium]